LNARVSVSDESAVARIHFINISGGSSTCPP
jgi:hypothetical protein